MKTFSTREAAKRLGITHAALSRYISSGKVPAPQTVEFGRFHVHAWTLEEIERLRELLPKIANGRKTRYQQLREAKRKTKKKQPKRK